MIQPHSPGSIDYLELVGVGSHPTFTELRGEGLSRTAIETLLLSHDALDAGMSPDAVADFIRDSQEGYPVTVEDVWPQGTPAHWLTEGERQAASLARQDRHYRTHPRIEATS